MKPPTPTKKKKKCVALIQTGGKCNNQAIIGDKCLRHHLRDEGISHYSSLEREERLYRRRI